MDISEKINQLPSDLKDFFMSNERRIALEKSCFLYGVSEDDIFKVSVVESAFFGEIYLKDVPLVLMQELTINAKVAYGIAYELNKNIFLKFPVYFKDAENCIRQWETQKYPPLISEEKAWSRVLEIEPWILEAEKEEEKERQEEEKEFESRTETLNINQALEKFSKINEQTISEQELVLNFSPNPVRPSIKNWIIDYRDALGAGKHSPIERGNYLFHSPNGKKLSAQDRQKVGTILRSLDEETLLVIDTKEEKVLFDAKLPQTSEQKTATNGYNSYVSEKPEIRKPDSQSNQETVDIFDRFKAVNSRQNTTINTQQDSLKTSSSQQESNGRLTTNQQSSTINLRPIANESNYNKQASRQTKPISNITAPNKEYEASENHWRITAQTPKSGDLRYGSSSFSGNSTSPEIAKKEEFDGGVLSFSSSQKLPFEIKNNPNQQSQISAAPRYGQEIAKKSVLTQQSGFSTAPQFKPANNNDEINHLQQNPTPKSVSNLKAANVYVIKPHGMEESQETRADEQNFRGQNVIDLRKEL